MLLSLRQIDSVDALRAVAPGWDDLWQRSDQSSALFRAEMVAQWLAQFARQTPPQILTVQRDGVLLAALPLCPRRAGRLLPVADLTMNDWSPNGDLLLDPHSDTEAVLSLLLEGLAQTPWPLAWFDCVPFDNPPWQALVAVARQSGWQCLIRPRYRIGQVDLSAGLEACVHRWSKNHRRNLRRDRRRLDEDGPTRLVLHRQLAPGDVEAPLRRAFEIEDSGWKGRGASSVLRTPGLFDFFLRQARQLVRWGSLSLAFLEHSGRPIAFEYGWIAKQVYYSYKIGYDENFRTYAPGHLVRMELLEALAAEGVRLVDFAGPMNRALAAWSLDDYPVGRLILAPPRRASLALLATLRAAARAKSLARRRGTVDRDGP